MLVASEPGFTETVRLCGVVPELALTDNQPPELKADTANGTGVPSLDEIDNAWEAGAEPPCARKVRLDGFVVSEVGTATKFAVVWLVLNVANERLAGWNVYPDSAGVTV